MAEPVLKKGSTDPAVRDLQGARKVLGHDPGPIDGVFGAKTESAVKAFQKAREIPVDGIVGRVTWINIDEVDQSEPVFNLKFALCRSRIGRSGAGFRGLGVAVYWTRAGAVPSRSKALSWSGVGLAERVIVAFGA